MHLVAIDSEWRRWADLFVEHHDSFGSLRFIKVSLPAYWLAGRIDNECWWCEFQGQLHFFWSRIPAGFGFSMFIYPRKSTAQRADRRNFLFAFWGGVEFKREIPLICDLICIPPPLEYKEAVRVWNNSICGWRNVLSEVFAATFGLCNTGRQVSLILFVFHPPWNTLGEHWKSVSLIAFWTILRFTTMTFWHSSGSFSVVAHGSFWCNQIPSWMDPSCRTCCDLGMQLNSYATAIS